MDKWRESDLGNPKWRNVCEQNGDLCLIAKKIHNVSYIDKSLVSIFFLSEDNLRSAYLADPDIPLIKGLYCSSLPYEFLKTLDLLSSVLYIKFLTEQ